MVAPALSPSPYTPLAGFGPDTASAAAPIDGDYRLLVDAMAQQLAPKPPSWYVPGRQPPVEEIKKEAAAEKAKHTQRVLDQAWMDMRVGQEIGAIFAADQPWVDLKEIEPQVSPLLRVMFDAIVNFIATQTVQITSLAQGMVNREERRAIEDHAAESLCDWDAKHFREGQGMLARTLTADALSGLVAVYHAPDPDNERSGQRLYRVDPKVVFPVFGRDGLDRVYVVYDATYPEVLRDYGGSQLNDQGQAVANDATRAIQRVARKGEGSGTRRIDSDTCYELIGYWDREYEIILWRGEVIRQRAHNLWVCPWHCFLPNWRNTGGAKNATGYVWQGSRLAPVDANGLSMDQSGGIQQDLCRRYEPFLAAWLGAADLFDKVLTRAGYAVDRAMDPATVWTKAPASGQKGAPEVQNYRGGVTELGANETLAGLPIDPLNEDFAPFFELFKIALQMAVPAPLLQGQNIGTQASGNALDVILAMGYAHFSPIVDFMQKAFREIVHRDLTYVRDWNVTYGPTGLGVAGGAGYGADPTRLTAEMLTRAGCYVECKLARFSLSGMAPAATTASLLNNMGIGTRVFYAKEFGFANAEQLVDDRLAQDMEDSPDFASIRAVELTYEQMERAAASDDEESLRRLGIRGKRLAALQGMRDMQRAQMTGVAEQQQMQQDQMAASGANPTPYLSNPQMGGQVGTQGGAPQQLALPGSGGTP